MASSSRATGASRRRTTGWTWWEEVNYTTSTHGGGSRPWVCKLCPYRRTGGADKVRVHLLHEGGHEVRFCPNVTPEKRRELQDKLAVYDAVEAARRIPRVAVDPATMVRAPRPQPSTMESCGASASCTPSPSPSSNRVPSSTTPTPSISTASQPMRPRRQTTLGENWNPILKEEVDMAVARYFYHDHTAFQSAR